MPPYKRQSIASVLVITNIICFTNNNLKYKGFAPEKVIYDSPVKTPLEVKEAIDLGFHMNLDNEREVFLYYLLTEVDYIPEFALIDWSSQRLPGFEEYIHSLHWVENQPSCGGWQHLSNVHSNKAVQVWAATDGGDQGEAGAGVCGQPLAQCHPHPCGQPGCAPGQVCVCQQGAAGLHQGCGGQVWEPDQDCGHWGRNVNILHRTRGACRLHLPKLQGLPQQRGKSISNPKKMN